MNTTTTRTGRQLSARGIRLSRLGALDTGGRSALGDQMPPTGSYAVRRMRHGQHRLGTVVPVAGGFQACVQQHSDADPIWGHALPGIYPTATAAAHAVADAAV